MKIKLFIVLMLIAGGIILTHNLEAKMKASDPQKVMIYNVEKKAFEELERVEKSEAEWKKLLNPMQFDVARKKGTERAFTGEYWDNHKKGIYQCVACGIDLFYSADKFDSGTGWPSYTKPVAEENVEMHEDNSFFSRRTEVVCPRCGSHLGHVFDDGPAPTHQRYCMNSAALKFKENSK